MIKLYKLTEKTGFANIIVYSIILIALLIILLA